MVAGDAPLQVFLIECKMRMACTVTKITLSIAMPMAKVGIKGGCFDLCSHCQSKSYYFCASFIFFIHVFYND